MSPGKPWGGGVHSQSQRMICQKRPCQETHVALMMSAKVCALTTTDEEHPVCCSTDIREQAQTSALVVDQQV